MKQAVIFNIQRFSIYDGPGVRTTVFFKGCNLRCRWCHNPESLSGQIQISLSGEKCIGCKKCFAVCPNEAHVIRDDGTHVIDRNKCQQCFRCVDTCYARALACIGEQYSVERLMKEINSDKMYFDNCKDGGGVTFSGGECMLQIEFLEELVRACKSERIHTAVDTAGNVPYEYFRKINPFVDIYLYDIKAFSSETHKKLTGVPNERIKENLVKLKEEGKTVMIRVPVIPGANDGEMEGIAAFLKEHTCDTIELLPYHSMGNAKADLLMEQPGFLFQEPSKEYMEKVADIFRDRGLYPKIRGGIS